MSFGGDKQQGRRTFSPSPLLRLATVIAEFLHSRRLSSLDISPKLVDVVSGCHHRCEPDKLWPKPLCVWLYSSQFGRGTRVKVVSFEVLVRVVYWVVGHLVFFQRKTSKALAVDDAWRPVSTLVATYFTL